MTSQPSRPNISKVQRKRVFCQHGYVSKSTINFKIALKKLIDDYPKIKDA